MPTYIEKLVLTHPLRDDLIRTAIQSLELSAGSRGLDAGCGAGYHTVLLAEEVGSGGHVTGFDLTPEFLSHAKGVAGKAGLTDRITFEQCDVKKLPFDDNSFDWLWSADCVGCAPTLAWPDVLGELARVIRPGGTMAVLAWSHQMLLPGFHLEEAKLNVAFSKMYVSLGRNRPELDFMRGLDYFRDTGFEKVEGRSFAGSVQAPLSREIREALIIFFDMLWGDSLSFMTDEDRAVYERLCRSGSPDFILDLSDYYAFFTCTMFCGRVGRSR